MSNIVDTDNKYIEALSKATGIKYSDEQIKILKHHGGMCILASAGSGKTSILTHLLAKRIMSGEIEDPSRLLCTTYSKGGATEMEVRVHKLLETVGINRTITVKTMHALYLSILREFGYPSSVMEESDRKRCLREACSINKMSFDDEEFRVLDSLISYQVNNLMTDAQLVQSYVFTLQITLDEYTKIRQEFINQKRNAGKIDFDDMQMYIFNIMCTENQFRDTAIRYCHSKWSDIYVDEAQDMSRIQYVILQKLISDPRRLVVIGDDDQCLVKGTQVYTPDGAKGIEEISPSDYVYSAYNNGKVHNAKLDGTHSKYYDGETVVVKTASGKIIEATPDHVGFVLDNTDYQNTTLGNAIKFELFDSKSNVKNQNTYSKISFKIANPVFAHIVNEYISIIDKYTCRYADYVSFWEIDTNRCEEIVKNILRDAERKGVAVELDQFAIIGGLRYRFTHLGEIEEGMYVPVMCGNDIIKDEVISVTSSNYSGYVYDISVPGYRNFAANGIIVHNCIYQWRGADPSIILNVCADYDISRFVLSTNYRCAGNIVEKAALGIVHNSRRSDKTMKPFKEGGEIKICDCGSEDIYEMSKHAYMHIRRLIMDEGVRPDNIAVLSRNNNHLSILSNMLFKDGIHCEMSSDMKMTTSLIYRQVRDIFKFAQDSNSTMHTVQGLLGTCMGMSRYNATRFMNIQKSSGVKVSELLGYIIKYILNRDIGSGKVVNIPNMGELSIERWVRELRSDTIESLVLIYKLLCDPDTKTRYTGLLACYEAAQAWKYENTPDRRRYVNGIISYLSDLIKTMGVNETKQLLTITEQYERGTMVVPGYKVNMTTIHGAKGKEWDHVIIFADDNISFPAFNGITHQMSKGVAISDIMYSIDEDRRLHYVAMTRARKELTIFTDSRNPGVFMLESMGIFDYGLQNNAHIISMAQSGEVYNQLLVEADKQLFDEKSPYNYAIDVSELKANIDVDYLYLGNTLNERKSISIDDIQTGGTF